MIKTVTSSYTHVCMNVLGSTADTHMTQLHTSTQATDTLTARVQPADDEAPRGSGGGLSYSATQIKFTFMDLANTSLQTTVTQHDRAGSDGMHQQAS